MATVKCELSTRRRNSWMVDSDTANKCVKRRRREPIASRMSSNDCYGKHVDFQQVDQSTSSTTTPKRSSRFRGVSRHKWTGRYEAHLWDKESWNVTQNKKGKQIYLGAYDEEESAGRAYDLAALKYWGSTTTTNFPVSDYQTDIEIMQNLTREEYLASLRRNSNGFSRGVSKYRGVARHHHNGKWEARIGRVSGNKYLYLGTYSTQEEAARAYDIAAIEQRGIKAMTNFELSMYSRWLKPESNVLINSHIPNSSIQSYVVPETSLSHTGTFTIDYLGSPQRQEALPREFVSNRPSLPSALSLLLRSSIFNDMVKKNPSSSQDEFDGDYRRQRSRSGTDDESDEIFYNQVEDIPYVSYDSNASLNFGVEENMSLSSFYSSLLKLVS